MNRVGTVYGQGLYALAQEEKLEEEILQQISVLDACFADQPEYLKLLGSHDIAKAERIAILDGDFQQKVHPYVLNFLKILTQKGYIRQFSACVQAYQAQYRQDRGIIQVQVVSAGELTQSQKERLVARLTENTGKTVEPIYRIDPGVMGGVRLAFDGKQVDGTVQGRLAEMAKQLKDTVV